MKWRWDDPFPSMPTDRLVWIALFLAILSALVSLASLVLSLWPLFHGVQPHA